MVYISVWGPMSPKRFFKSCISVYLYIPQVEGERGLCARGIRGDAWIIDVEVLLSL